MPILYSLLPYGTEVPGYLRCPFHFLAAILYGFMAVQCEHSEAHEREKRERNPCCEPTMFYASDNTPLRSSRRSRDAGFPIIYLNLQVRLKKVHGFYTVFSVFPLFSPFFLDFPTKSAVFSRFISVSGNRGIYVF